MFLIYVFNHPEPLGGGWYIHLMMMIDHDGSLLVNLWLVTLSLSLISSQGGCCEVIGAGQDDVVRHVRSSLGKEAGHKYLINKTLIIFY